MAMSVGLIFSVARRAEHLAKLQMEFVTGVSHELCTPLVQGTSFRRRKFTDEAVVDEPMQIQEYMARSAIAAVSSAWWTKCSLRRRPLRAIPI